MKLFFFHSICLTHLCHLTLHDSVLNSRPLRRAIQSLLEDSLAEKILDGTVKEGERVLVSKGENGLIFETKKTTGKVEEVRV